MVNKNVQALARLAELPGLIQGQERIILGLKDEKAKNERKKKATEARLWLTDESRGMKPVADREAAHLLACEASSDWLKAVERLEELRRTIAKHEAQRDLLRREREGVKVTLEHAFADRLEAALGDKDLARMIGTGFSA